MPPQGSKTISYIVDIIKSESISYVCVYMLWIMCDIYKLIEKT